MPSPSFRPSALVIPLAAAGLLLAGPAWIATAAAQPAPASAARSYNIPAGPLAAALTRFVGESGIFLAGAAELTQGKSSPGLQGSHTPQAGLALLLAGSGLEALEQGAGTYALRVAVALDGPSLPVMRARASAEQAGDLPKPYAGGQVARGGRVGLLGDRDFMDTPFNLIPYTAQAIEDRQARTLADLGDNNPALRSIYPANDAITDFIVRGNKLKALDSSYGGLYGLMSPGLEALERVDILSGASTLLNGLGPTGSVGGSINQTPKRAADAPLTRLTAGFFSDSQLGLHADIGRRFGADNQFGVRLNTSYSDGDTAIDHQSKQVGMAALALDYRSERVRLSADLGFRRNDTQVPSRTAYVAAGFAIPAPPESGLNWQQLWSYENVRSTLLAVRGEVDVAPELTAYAAAGVSAFKQAQLFANSFLLNNAGALRQSQVYWPLYRDSQTAELGLRGTAVTGPVKHSWSVAASGLSIKNGILLNNLALTTTNIFVPVFIDPPGIAGLAGPGDVPQTGATRLSGLAVADTLSAWDGRLQLTVGVRRQNVVSENINPKTGEVTPPRYDKSATTPGLGIVIKTAPNVSLYANYMEGLQQGPTAPATAANAGEVFEPYVSKQYEAGVKIDFGALATTLGAYQLSTPNGLTDPVSKRYGIDGEQRTRGIEFNAFGEVAAGLKLLGGLALVDARQTKTLGGVNDGRHVTGAPKFQLNLGTDWALTGLPGLSLSARALYTSAQYLDAINAQAIPSWTRLDAGARYGTRWNGVPTTWRLNLQNVFDKSYWSSAIDGYLVQSAPRTVSLTAAFDF